VRKLHFNASGEGKRCETDGHNTDIKSRRESAMRAGEPTACTPDSEAQAQLHGGGIPGSYPVVLDFNHNSEVKVGSWEGILSFHDFELHENRDVTAWKSAGIGPGKKCGRKDWKHGAQNMWTHPQTTVYLYFVWH
jgi:hypothetical protein